MYQISAGLEPILWFVRKDNEREEKIEPLVSRISETPGTIYFNFGIRSPPISTANLVIVG